MTDAEIDQAVADDVLDLFVVERLLVPSSGRRYTRRRRAISSPAWMVDLLEHFWRALGFANVRG